MSTPGAVEVAAAAEAVEAALRAHLAAVVTRRGETDPVVHEAFQVLRQAFLAYDAALYDVYDEVLPVEVVTYVDEDEDEDDDLEI